MNIASLKNLFVPAAKKAPAQQAPEAAKPKPPKQADLYRDAYIKLIQQQQEYYKQHPDAKPPVGMGDHSFWANPASYHRFADKSFWANPDSYRGHGR